MADAQALCEGILKERPHEAQAFHLLGLIAYREAVNLMGQIAFERGAYEAALAFYEREVALAPDAPDALANRGHVLRELNRFAPAVASFERALAIAPRHAVALGGLIDCALRTCDWARAVALAGTLASHVTERGSFIEPFTLLAATDDPEKNRALPICHTGCERVCR